MYGRSRINSILNSLNSQEDTATPLGKHILRYTTVVFPYYQLAFIWGPEHGRGFTHIY